MCKISTVEYLSFGKKERRGNLSKSLRLFSHYLNKLKQRTNCKLRGLNLLFKVKNYGFSKNFRLFVGRF